MRDSVQKIGLDLSAKIESGEWTGGCRLPPERRLAEEPGLARSTLRQALAAVEQRALIVHHVGRDSFVRAESRPALADWLLAKMPNVSSVDQRTVTPASRHHHDRHHSTIVTALRERDAETARKAMTEHLTMVREHLVGAAA